MLIRKNNKNISCKVVLANHLYQSKTINVKQYSETANIIVQARITTILEPKKRY